MKNTAEVLLLRNLKRAQYASAGVSAAIFVIFLALVALKSAPSEAASAMILGAVALSASASAVIASFIRFRDGRHYAYSTFLAFFFFSLLHTICQHTAIFIIVITGFAAAVFALSYGAYTARSDKLTVAKYVGVIVGMTVAFLTAYVGL